MKFTAYKIIKKESWLDPKNFIAYELKNGKAKKIFQLDLENNLIKEWNSIIEAHKSLSDEKNYNKIIKCLKGRIETAFGYKWKYIDK